MSFPQQLWSGAMRSAAFQRCRVVVCVWIVSAGIVHATPSNRAALEKHYDRFLAKGLNQCTTCHLPGAPKNPESLEEIPHNPFGDRLRVLGEELEAQGKGKDLVSRLGLLATEDADADGVANEVELLAGTNPGDVKDAPVQEKLAGAAERHAEFEKFLASYRWMPFERVKRPDVPQVKRAEWVRNPVDAFIAAEHEAKGLTPRPEASKAVLLRRVYMDLIGLSPTPEEQLAFLGDESPDAYEKVIDRLLQDPRYGERWGRHWMDVWRYSDWAGWTDGGQIRDSHRHIWRWRDWIVESLNADRGYGEMVTDMLAADELKPGDPDALRATGFLVRNFKLLSREQWLEDTVKHTTQALMGVTVGCAKCHDHMTDPVSQAEYFQIRAIFEPHQVRMDHVPGELDLAKNGLSRAYDAGAAPTYFFIRGDERRPDKERVMSPGVPKALGGKQLEIAPVTLPKDAALPERREFVIRETMAASDAAVAKALDALVNEAKPELRDQRRLELAQAEVQRVALLAVLRAEELEEAGKKDTDEWKAAAMHALERQRAVALSSAHLAMHKANHAEEKVRAKQKEDAEKALAKAEAEAKAELTVAYKPRMAATYPATSTGRRSAFAKWLASRENPLTARVAVNHIWLRHFGRGIVNTPADFGRSGNQPSHPALLDWLAEEFMESGWKMKALHRLLVTSSTYRMSSTPDEENAARDIDNVFLWRMPSRRLEAELVRDNLLYVAGSLDATLGGPEIDHAQGLTSRRRSMYLRLAAEKEVEFLKIFDGPSITECYQRHTSVIPQQALAMGNSEITIAQARVLAAKITEQVGDDSEAFIRAAFVRILARPVTAEELAACRKFIGAEKDGVQFVSNPAPDLTKLRERLILVLFNHNDFITIR
ncbi:MAG: DUF1549 and DUF1553 domain-containing protein [Chthoniobacteraceae bacterium]